ncbi:MAG: hypothetical protein JXQ91_07575 [Vannielia sp.]|uniref:hypothetical protein n=1 Tax=Vannielia sp. TaxID=2813045 RepID=UPI003B8DA943
MKNISPGTMIAAAYVVGVAVMTAIAAGKLPIWGAVLLGLFWPFGVILLSGE